MNIIKKLIIEWEVKAVLTNLFQKINGWKTYLISALGIGVAVIGHFWGPLHLANGLDIPAQTWDDVFKVIWGSAIVSALRHGVAKTEVASVTGEPQSQETIANVKK